MLYLILAIVCSTILAILFKLFGKHGIDTFQAIVFNYITCFTLGSLLLGRLPFEEGFWQQPWFPYALGLGVFFITGFNIQAACVRTMGMTITAVLQRMSLIVTVVFAFFYLQESFTWLKLLGILCAFAAIYFTSYTPSGERNAPAAVAPSARSVGWWWIPVLTFATNAIIDSSLLFLEKRVMGQSADLNFTIFLFGTAGVLGVVAYVAGWLTGKVRPHWRNSLAGIVLGIPNFGSIYFLLQALGTGFEGSVMFPMMNVGIIILTTIVAYLFLAEALTSRKLVGIGLAVVAIGLMALGS